MSDKAELSRAGTMVTTAKVNIFLAYENAQIFANIGDQ